MGTVFLAPRMILCQSPGKQRDPPKKRNGGNEPFREEAAGAAATAPPASRTRGAQGEPGQAVRPSNALHTDFAYFHYHCNLGLAAGIPRGCLPPP